MSSHNHFWSAIFIFTRLRLHSHPPLAFAVSLTIILVIILITTDSAVRSSLRSLHSYTILNAYCRSARIKLFLVLAEFTTGSLHTGAHLFSSLSFSIFLNGYLFVQVSLFLSVQSPFPFFQITNTSHLFANRANMLPFFKALFRPAQRFPATFFCGNFSPNLLVSCALQAYPRVFFWLKTSDTSPLNYLGLLLTMI